MKKFGLALFLAVFFLGKLSFGQDSLETLNSKNNSSIIFPRPFAFAIDDLGWNIGNDEGYGDNQGPYRIGVDRKMDINDYKCMVAVAEEVGVRLQALFVMGEMDRENVLAKCRGSNRFGNAWDNSANVNDGQIEIMDYVKNNAAYLEFGLHGLMHEYWTEPEKRTRAEWYDVDNNTPRSTEIMQDHIHCFKEIMAQYGITKQNGHSFPESFVPCAYAYHWNPEGEVSTGLLMNKEGVKYVNTLFSEIPELNPPSEPNGGGIDHGVLVLNRVNYGNDWFALSALPTTPIAQQESDVIEAHWSNWLAQDDFLQEETNSKWIAYYRMVQEQENRYMAKNTEQFYAQWLYKKYTVVTEDKTGTVVIDNTTMPDEMYQHELLGNLVLKVKLIEGQHVSNAKINGNNMAAYFEEGGYGIIYLPELEQKKYVLEYKTGLDMPETFIWHDGTFNVYSFDPDDEETRTQIRLYGKQNLTFFGIHNPDEIKITNPNIILLANEYDNKSQKLTLTLSAKDMQGETSEIVLVYRKNK